MGTRHDTNTPTLSVIDPRALAIRSVAYYRHPHKADIESRITRQIFDEAGRQVASWDPRLYGVAPKPNLATLYALSGQELLTDSVDAGWQVLLLNEAGSMCSGWDARGSQSHRQYDDLQRPLALTEQAHDGQSRVVERWIYGKATDDRALHNQCGRPIRHDDPAGNRHFADYGLGGAVVVESRRFLIELETPDWPLDPDRRDDCLEETTYITRQTFTPNGDLQHHTDAVGNLRTQHYNIAGQACATWLLQAGEGRQPKCLVSAIRYNAQGQIESETAGNGVIARAEYSRDDGRLLRLLASVGAQKPLQDLNYIYDPVGNIVSLEDKTQVVSWFNNQRIDPVSRYRYDSRYQLVEASGWEVSQPSHGPALPDLLPTPLDPNQRRNYTQTFAYDAAGNLITRHHSGALAFSMFTSAYSNRSLAQRDDGSLPGEAEIALGFDAVGNQLELQRGQAMTWNIRNELNRVVLVQRANEIDDYECYGYDEPGHRLRKTTVTLASERTLKAEVRYLSGLEIHHEVEGVERHVINVDAGRNQVRVLHWASEVEVDQVRYSLSDHLASSTLELDEDAGLLSQEHYYPFGGTACWAGKNALAAKNKTIRYSGKERDATGLYYYGYRYYASWLQRWISGDPAGAVNGLNLFCFVANKPVVNNDLDGRWFYEGENDFIEISLVQSGKRIVSRGLDQFPMHLSAIISSQLPEMGQVFSEAIYALAQGFTESPAVLQSYFGPEYRTVENQLSHVWMRGLDMTNAYGGQAARGKFLGFVGGPGPQRHSNAEVRPDDFYGRIAINLSRVDGDFAMVLGHELLHLNRVNRISAVGPNAVDNFYLNSRSPEILNYPVMQYELPARGISEAIMNGGLNSEFSERYPASHRDFITSVENYMGLPGMLDLETSISMFNEAPHMRAQMALNNADSIVFAAKSMSQLYRARQENSSLFYNLING
jgi:insecticidal toxin complex protein TccC